MGNEDSTRWKRGYRKLPLVEDSLLLCVNEMSRQGCLVPGEITVGAWPLPATGGTSPLQYHGFRGLVGYIADLRSHCIEYRVTGKSRSPDFDRRQGIKQRSIGGLRLRYDLNVNGVALDYSVPLEIWPCRFGGCRFWFRCPLCLVEEPSRCMRLYLPPGEMRFGCRECHGLTYRKCQAHRHPPRAVPLCAGEMDIVLQRLAGKPFDRDLSRQLSRVLRSIY